MERGFNYNEKNVIPMEMEASNFVLGIIATRGWSESSISRRLHTDAKTGHFRAFSKWKDKSTPESRQKLFDKMKGLRSK